MARIALTDGSGKWFDNDKAQEFTENTEWNGNNNISKVTGCQWDHQILYRTASGRWVLNAWSQCQGTMESYFEITDQEAAEWFMKNEYSDENIPPDLLALLADEIKELEV